MSNEFDDSTAAAAATMMIFGLIAIIFGPICVIWALNTLFAFAIPFTLKTWAAALVLSSVVSKSVLVPFQQNKS